MSQDNQNSQPSSSSVPKPNQPQLPDEQVNESRQLPTWKLKIIQILRGTMRILDTVVVQLETSPPPVTEGTLTFWQHLERQWNRFLRQVRLFLPSNVSNNLSDIVLTGILAVIILAIVWSTATIFTEKPTEIATVIPVEEVSPPTPKIIIAPELTTPEPIPEPIPEPTPILKLTPEEALIAAIENQVAEISDRFASGLIGSIQANFRTSNLTLKINDDWYTLPESEQKQLATEILQRARELDFTHLEIVDSQDRLIARNPVVGNEMIIFQFIFQNLTINPEFKLYLV
ncbi:hypothetical protein [Umezakia ovalisporum]|uniref:Uncharacterized protein n=1 Tax=Umezakia ovalisporum FSS-43 TaxID=2740520 RepID=A0ABT6K456_9CYAN|nr:hypothetical protein [Umezakia ovalisporum]MDH6057133.1 hypothetical protein [Umezakia ovalisporum FSS-43]MDH6067135.1 hypothetical protein [Umezakia ovalisporum APH033B]MDH6071446.1 hypothetical protein [Umezakia ovalisporum CobakiLakeA]MDH6083006.1 hypothetical protein [Umezakia ovalisporum FSS-44]MDH6096167.1 hypothetical protein [Umezakia ovalisporum CobakiLakeB]